MKTGLKCGIILEIWGRLGGKRLSPSQVTPYPMLSEHVAPNLKSEGKKGKTEKSGHGPVSPTRSHPSDCPEQGKDAPMDIALAVLP